MTSHPVQPAVMPARKNKKDRFLHLAKNRLRTEDLTQGFESPSTLPLPNEPLGISHRGSNPLQPFLFSMSHWGFEPQTT